MGRFWDPVSDCVPRVFPGLTVTTGGLRWQQGPAAECQAGRREHHGQGSRPYNSQYAGFPVWSKIEHGPRDNSGAVLGARSDRALSALRS